VRLAFALAACVLMLLNIPFAAGFAIWLAYGPPPEQPIIVPVSAAAPARRLRDDAATVADLVT
jgi:hypothetical protein